MTLTRFVDGQILFKEGDASDGVFRLLSGSVDVVRELDGDIVLLGTVGVGELIGEMGVVESRPRSATVRATSEVEAEFLKPTEFLDQIASSPQAARELIRRLSQRLREADDRIVTLSVRSGSHSGVPSLSTGRRPTTNGRSLSSSGVGNWCCNHTFLAEKYTPIDDGTTVSSSAGFRFPRVRLLGLSSL